jgi:coatomer subunit beta
MESNCTLLVALPDKLQLPTVAEISSELELADPTRKIAALKKAIMLVLAGEETPRVLMTVIRFCITVEDHTLQKLLML